ncbi:MAG: hypothetical protein HYZ29_15725 [Myxococcales bacterium]|nr:hypothetical protein [Myxococcales bacterium]
MDRSNAPRRKQGWASVALVAVVLTGACGPNGCGGGGGGTGGAAGSGGLAGTGGAAGFAGSGGAVGGAAGAAGAAGSATAGSGGINPGDGGTGGVAPDASADAPSDATDSGPVSVTCGDGIRGLDEECDDGNTSNEDACTTACVVNDFLCVAPPVNDSGKLASGRYLGEGRHPIAADADGFAVAYVEPGFAPPRVALNAFDPKGVRIGSPLLVSTGTKSKPLLFSSPVVAPLPGAKYAVAWTDFDGDGDALGVALRLVEPPTAPSGEPAHANKTTAFSQFDPDVLWTGTDLVVAWVDDSDAVNGPDLRYRVFDAALNPQSTSDQTLVGSANAEANVALGRFGSTWAAAWRATSSNGSETVEAKSGSTTWSIGPHAPPGALDKPALAELDPSTLLVVFTVGDAGTGAGSKLRGALLSSTVPGATSAIALDTGLTVPQSHPNAVRVGARTFLTWRSTAVSGDPKSEELWLRELQWNASTLTLGAPLRLPRWAAHTPGDQRFPALAASPLGPEGALVTGWDDFGLVFGKDEGAPDVVVELIPVPILRKTLLTDGGAG